MDQQRNFLMVSIIPQHLTDEEAFTELQELKFLIDAYGGKVKEIVTQRRELQDKGPYIGRGKIGEIAAVIEEQHINIIVLNGSVKASQTFELKRGFEKVNPKIEVWDRVDLILQIFSKHAHTAEARLQIELAAMRHMGPRIYGMGMVLSRQSGGIGGRGIGETNTELMKRHWRDQIKKTQDRLQKLTLERERQLEHRQKLGLQTVSIIGYTNAGKTSLFNLLSGKKKMAQNVLFATLDSTVGKLYLPEAKKEILLSDTIGFIRNLPTKLIDAFKSTLMESMHADLLLHVIDVSDPNMRRKIQVVEDILYDLGIQNKRQIYVFNKFDQAMGIDREKISEEYHEFEPQFVSVKNGEGITPVLTIIEKALS